jgi:hypothetical protein
VSWASGLRKITRPFSVGFRTPGANSCHSNYHDEAGLILFLFQKVFDFIHPSIVMHMHSHPVRRFFDVGKDDLADVSAVYDHASLVSLPPEIRERYARHLMSVLPSVKAVVYLT